MRCEKHVFGVRTDCFYGAFAGLTGIAQIVGTKSSSAVAANAPTADLGRQKC
jgi:hypothetical protein